MQYYSGFMAHSKRTHIAPTLLLAFGALLAAACKSDDPKTPMATPSLTIDPNQVPLGNPVEMTYKFVVARDAKFTKDYRVMVHFADQDQTLMYQDDHDPPVPTSQWAPGQTIEYKRRFFMPVYPYVGDATIEVGLYCNGCTLRASLDAQDMGHRSYLAAHLQLLPQSEGVAVRYKQGWYEIEGSDTSGEGSWHWMRKNATLAIKNPKKDSVLYLKVGNASSAYKESQHVTVSLEGGPPLDQFTLSPEQKLTLRTIQIPAASWGTRDTVDLQLSVDKSFVPDLLWPPNDRRELAVQVYKAVVVRSRS
jgi:hypothetical protein